jgi:hypothetical protein
VARILQWLQTGLPAREQRLQAGIRVALAPSVLAPTVPPTSAS